MVKAGDIVVAVVARIEDPDIIVDIDGAEARLPVREQVRGESHRVGERMITYVVETAGRPGGSPTIVSRASKGLLERLFEMEVPEIHQAIVHIEGSAREPGVHSKIAVSSGDAELDPVEACRGDQGSRAEAVRTELRGERIDVVRWDSNPARLVCNALAPAEVSRVVIDTTTHTLEVRVDDDQLSLAIGRNGLNLRLASLITEWNVEIRPAGD